MKSRILSLLLLLAAPLTAYAHAHLLQASPADGSVLDSPPPQFAFTFSESAQLTALSLQKQGEPQPRKLGPLPAAAAAQQRVPAPQLDPGAYELRYRIISADGHVMAGSVHFTLLAAGAAHAGP